MFELVEKNKYGFYSIKEIPSKEELKEYYETKYYQNEVEYDHKYSEEEQNYISNKIAQKHRKAQELMGHVSDENNSILDVGCGEGWTLKYFNEKGWDVTGVDFSEFGVKMHNPDLLDNVRQGDLEEKLQDLIKEGAKFDLVWLDNVLEHVIDPLKVLKMCNDLTNSGGILIIEVPNDFSPLQKHLIEKKIVSKPFWVAPPDHLSYFNKDGLNAICDDAGWSCLANMSDFAIDLFLLNSNTNYVENSEVGKSCHLARIAIENFLHEQGIDKVNKYYEALADLGLGREIIGYYQKR